jgi:2-iminobutanoate/2-iminopropanoate deaminase
MASKKRAPKQSAKKRITKKSTAKKSTVKKSAPAKKTTQKTTPKSGALGPYTPVVRAGDWVIVSGQLGVADGKVVKGGVAAETAQAIINLKSQLASVGLTLNDVKKTLCFLTDMDTFATFNDAYVKGFAGSRPARSTIGVAALPFRGAVEIEAWAFKPVR